MNRSIIRFPVASLIVVFASCMVSGAMAADCAPPTLINSLSMEQVPGSDTMTVTATFDGSPERLLVGIGDVPTALWNAQAVKLDLPVWEGRRTMDAGGRFTEDVSRIETFTLGNMETGNFNIPIVPDPDYANSGTDGALGTNMMQRYDIDLDFAHQRLNYFSPEQCQGAGIYWAPSKIGSVKMVTYADVAYVPVTLDGHTIIALLDTAADKTFLNPQVAKDLFGLKADSLEPGNVTDSGALIKAGIHVFSSLTVGGLTVNNPQIAIPFDILTQDNHEFHANHITLDRYPLSQILPDLVIGMDVLKQTHLYISFQNQRVYVSAAEDGQAALKPAPIKTSWFNVWTSGYDPYIYPYRHPFVNPF